VKNSITYVAMDTHKKEHKVALHYPGDEEIVQFTVKNTVSDTAIPQVFVVGAYFCRVSGLYLWIYGDLVVLS